jgi:arginyl-tRNA--protein-N-Asp/Glu arginylyltransferase
MGASLASLLGMSQRGGMAVPTHELARFTSPPRSCSYLPTETASLAYRVHAGMDEQQFYELLRRGWRRHGAHLFRPRCPVCTQCRSLRVLVDEFEPSRSQRRILQRNQDVQVYIGPASVSPDHVRVYNAYHADMSLRRGWPHNETTVDDYANSFLIGEWPFAHEMLYYERDELIGVGLVDIVSEAVSSVYFFHAPDWRPRAPGTFSILQELQFCRATGRRFNYLGYWIAGCQSMAYKSNYTPHEILDGYIDPPTEPRWLRATSP